jgi:photosystem II stability/assembly factor-like uncharacterized protein
MDERELFDRFHAALDVQPLPGAFDRLQAALAESPATHRRWPALMPQLPPIALRFAAIVLALLLVVTATAVFLAVHRAPPRPIPAEPPSIAPKTSCLAPPASPGANTPPVLAKMLSLTTGWAYGPLRTTDGGRNWVDVSPPSVPSRASGTAEFFLDATHAWVAETAGSSRACADHVVTFSTTDAGRTWRQAAPIQAKIGAGTDTIWAGTPKGAHWLYFIDPLNGWLLVESGPPGIMAPLWSHGDLYRTTDGGLHWKAVASNPGAAAGCQVGDGMSFASATTGWITLGSCGGGPVSGLLVTHDGGVTWGVQRLPATTYGSPVFLDASHGVLTDLDAQGFLATADGGRSWQYRGLPPGRVLVDFSDPSRGWVVANVSPPPGTDLRLYQTTDGGAIWTPMKTNLPQSQSGGDWSFQFVDARTGFLALGLDLQITSDGGGSWTVVQTTVQGK